MKTSSKWALILFALHTVLDLFFVLLAALCRGDGERELGVLAGLFSSVDFFFIPLTHGHLVFIQRAFLSFPEPLQIYAYILLLSLPFGGAIYGAAGWLFGYGFDRRRTLMQGA